MKSRVRAFDRWLTLEHPDTEEAEKVIEEVLVGNVYRVEPDHIAGKVVVDAGANVGTFTTLAIALGARFMVWFEPGPANSVYLYENAERARKEHNPDVKYTGTMFAVEDPALGSVTYRGDGATGFVEKGDNDDVQVMGFGAMLNMAGGKVDFLKVDVEGGEYGWFRDATSEQLAHVNLIRMETHGSKTSAAIDGEGPIGELVTKLLHTHSVTAFGRPADGGILLAHAYEWPDDA